MLTNTLDFTAKKRLDFTKRGKSKRVLAVSLFVNRRAETE